MRWSRQGLGGGDVSYLLHRLSVVNTYTEVTTGSRWVAVVVQNLMVIPITTTNGVKVTQVVAANVVPPVNLAPRSMEKIDQIQGNQQMRMSVK